MTIKRYLEDQSVDGSAMITGLFPGEQPAVRLDRTLFHPQSGGQKADRGYLAEIPVLHVQLGASGSVDHYLADLSHLRVGTGIQISVDSQSRQLNSAYHTAGHLLAGIAEDLLDDVYATFGHHWPGEAHVQFEERRQIINLDTRRDELMHALNQRLKQSIESMLPVTQLGDPYVNRAIQIGDFDPIRCGGTHLQNLMGLQEVRVTKIKRKKGVPRISYNAYPK